MLCIYLNKFHVPCPFFLALHIYIFLDEEGSEPTKEEPIMLFFSSYLSVYPLSWWLGMDVTLWWHSFSGPVGWQVSILSVITVENKTWLVSYQSLKLTNSLILFPQSKNIENPFACSLSYKHKRGCCCSAF